MELWIADWQLDHQWISERHRYDSNMRVAGVRRRMHGTGAQRAWTLPVSSPPHRNAQACMVFTAVITDAAFLLTLLTSWASAGALLVHQRGSEPGSEILPQDH